MCRRTVAWITGGRSENSDVLRDCNFHCAEAASASNCAPAERSGMTGSVIGLQVPSNLTAVINAAVDQWSRSCPGAEGAKFPSLAMNYSQADAGQIAPTTVVDAAALPPESGVPGFHGLSPYVFFGSFCGRGARFDVSIDGLTQRVCSPLTFHVSSHGSIGYPTQAVWKWHDPRRIYPLLH